MICIKCGKEFPNFIIINEIKHKLYGRKHCIECLPIGVHNINMGKKCKKCGEIFSTYVIIDGDKKHLNHRKYCLKCSPFGKHNTVKLSGEQKVSTMCGKLYITDWEVIQQYYDEGYTWRMLITKFNLNGKVLKQAKDLGLFNPRTTSEAYRVAEKYGRLDNKHHTEETKIKLSKIKIDLYSNYPEKHPNRKLAGNRSKMTYPEKLVANLFDNRGIIYKHNAYIKPYWIDFLVNDIGIEVDGEKWHDIEKDAIRDAYILNSGITIIRFKAKDVIKNPEIVLSVV